VTRDRWGVWKIKLDLYTVVANYTFTLGKPINPTLPPFLCTGEGIEDYFNGKKKIPYLSKEKQLLIMVAEPVASNNLPTPLPEVSFITTIRTYYYRRHH
jgi:hypothetical protein